MQMTLSDGTKLTLTPEEFIEMSQKMRELESAASPTEAKADTVEHKKPKAGDLIEVTGDGQVGNLSHHGYPVGTILTVRHRIDTPDDRVYAGRLPSMQGGMMIHKSFYKVVTRNVVAPGPYVPHVFGVGDIVRVTEDHSRASRNKTGDIGVITTANASGSFRVYVAARDDVTEGRNYSFGDNQKPDSFELVIAKKDRKDSAVHE